MNIDEPLMRVLRTYCDVNALELVNEISNSLNLVELKKLKQQLSDTIEQGSISPKVYEKLTGDEYETKEKLHDWLIELWEIIYGTTYKSET